MGLKPEKKSKTIVRGGGSNGLGNKGGKDSVRIISIVARYFIVLAGSALQLVGG